MGIEVLATFLPVPSAASFMIPDASIRYVRIGAS
jgi:hypothetical protein